MILVSFFLVPDGVSAQDKLLTLKNLLSLEPAPADQSFFYGPDNQQFAQLRLPKGSGPHPVVIVIHGGCWSAPFGLDHISPLASEITKLGFATWSIEYRRIGDKGGGWPGTFQDVAAAADFLTGIASDFSLDLEHTIALGHSAGGHLALWLASRTNLEEKSPLFRKNPLRLIGVISLAGVGDLELAHQTEICGQAVRDLMGGSPSDFPERYLQGSPSRLLPLRIRQILIQGKLDSIVPPESVEAYLAVANRSGDEIDIVMIDGAGHFEVVIPGSVAWPHIRKAVQDLLKMNSGRSVIHTGISAPPLFSKVQGDGNFRIDP